MAGKPTGRMRWLGNPPTGPKQWGHGRKITSSTAEYKLDVLAARNKDFGEGKHRTGDAAWGAARYSKQTAQRRRTTPRRCKRRKSVFAPENEAVPEDASGQDGQE